MVQKKDRNGSNFFNNKLTKEYKEYYDRRSKYLLAGAIALAVTSIFFPGIAGFILGVLSIITAFASIYNICKANNDEPDCGGFLCTFN